MVSDQSAFDPTDPEFPDRLVGMVGEVREQCPVKHFDELGGFWMLTRYADVARAARDWRTFSSAGQGTMIPPLGSSCPAIPPSSDPPDHTVYRRLLTPYFTPAAIAHHEQSIRECCASLLDTIDFTGQVELMDLFVEPIPSTALAMLLGLEREDWPLLRSLTRDMLQSRFLDKTSAQAGMKRFEDYVDDLIARRTATPKDDVTTAIVQGEMDGVPLQPEVVRGIIFVCIAAGHETVVNGIGNLAYRIAASPDLRDALVQTPSLIPAAVEESLRFDPPTQWLGRTTTKDATVGDVTIPAGDRVMLMWMSANRDSDAFDSPDVFRSTREPNRHVAFGLGIHRCVGEHLARLEMRIAIEELLRHCPDVQLARPNSVRWKFNTHVRGPSSLTVRRASLADLSEGARELLKLDKS